MKRVIIIDQNNMFFRHYVVDPSISANGNPIGGLQGSIKGLQKFLKDLNPDMVIICWDGFGGSKKRKQINKNYKNGRSPARLNRNIQDILNPAEELENQIWQLSRLTEYYDIFPIVQFLIDNLEADDIISYTAQMEYFKDWQKVIISSDQDFIQLLTNNKTILYRPIQKQILSLRNVEEIYGIHPSNFVLARSIIGDKSDNLSGIKGVGFKRLISNFSFLRESRVFTIDDVFEECKKQLSLEEEKKNLFVFQSILEGAETINTNYKLMSLAVTNLGLYDQKNVKETIENFKPVFNKTQFQIMRKQDGFVEWKWDYLYTKFNKIVRDHK